jgi:hypothetical protein
MGALELPIGFFMDSFLAGLWPLKHFTNGMRRRRYHCNVERRGYCGWYGKLRGPTLLMKIDATQGRMHELGRDVEGRVPMRALVVGPGLRRQARSRFVDSLMARDNNLLPGAIALLACALVSG